MQFNSEFRFADALALVPYLSRLGISHIYASPLFKACPGSSHGYDVCDFNSINPELGTESDLLRLVSELRRHGMGLVLDIVPNHMGIGPENAWWWDVLAHGQDSRFARHFDIFWQSPGRSGDSKVIVPVLGNHYEQVLESGELYCDYHEGKFTVNYFEKRFPIAPESVLGVLKRADQFCNEIRGAPAEADRPDFPPGVADAECVNQAISAALRELNEDKNALDDLLQQQHYRLVFWRRGDGELNYRRFFNIPTLAGVRVEDRKVFADAHALLRKWLDAGLVDGLRVDHIDGLADPRRYLECLRVLAPHAWIVVEKIMGPGELIPASWPVAGTSGYDFVALVDGLFVDPAGEEPLTRFYSEFTGEPVDATAVMRQGKRRVLNDLFASEVGRLSEMLAQISTRHSRSFGFERDSLSGALVEVTACFPVYRTYVQPGQGIMNEADFESIREAVSSALKERPDLADAIDFLNRLLLLELQGPLENEFVTRFQQLTGAVMAKGVEDTAFYRFNRFVALNEVGGDPGRFGIGPELFHDQCLFRQARQPDAMLATSTHDTKRSEDVRARLSLLSEIPDRWQQAVKRWSAMNEPFRRDDLPDRNAEYLLYQTLVGAWPISVERAVAYIEKAAREAKEHTTWTDQNWDYESALRDFISRAMANSEFTTDLDAFVGSLSDAGWINSLAKTLLKLTAPGVPDMYQGTDLWNLDLVDPDNRRPVDFTRRRRLLAESDGYAADQIWSSRREGLPKQWLIRQTLKIRAERPELFLSSSDYQPCHAQGAKAAHVVAFIRGGALATIVPRLVLGLADDWKNTTIELPAGNWRNVFTREESSGGRVPLAELLRGFLVALLIR